MPKESVMPRCEQRLDFFRAQTANRCWWFGINGCAYLPAAFALLDDDEWSVMASWFDQTYLDRGEAPGSAMSLRSNCC